MKRTLSYFTRWEPGGDSSATAPLYGTELGQILPCRHLYCHPVQNHQHHRRYLTQSFWKPHLSQPPLYLLSECRFLSKTVIFSSVMIRALRVLDTRLELRIFCPTRTFQQRQVGLDDDHDQILACQKIRSEWAPNMRRRFTCSKSSAIFYSTLSLSIRSKYKTQF